MELAQVPLLVLVKLYCLRMTREYGVVSETAALEVNVSRAYETKHMMLPDT